MEYIPLTQFSANLFYLFSGTPQDIAPTTIVPERSASDLNELFSKNNMTAQITKYTIETGGDDEYVGYHIDVQVKDLKWRLTKRYSECLDFHTKLMTALIAKDKTKLFVFPPKLYTRQSNFNEANVQQRLSQLQSWFDEIVTSDPSWFNNYDKLVHEFLETRESIVKHIASVCTVPVTVVEQKLNETGTDGVIPDANQAIEFILNEKAREVMEQTGDTLEDAKQSLASNENTVSFAVKFSKNIQQVMQKTGIQDRSKAIELYNVSGFNVTLAVDNFKRNPNLLNQQKNSFKKYKDDSSDSENDE
jgi:hypothetical protein